MVKFVRAVAITVAALVCLSIALLAAFDVWEISQTHASLLVHLRDRATIERVRASLCGNPVQLSQIDRTNYRFEARLVFWCQWQELGVDIIGVNGTVRHHQYCYYEAGGFPVDATAEVAPDRLVLRCRKSK
jgi:hypothetical protein